MENDVICTGTITKEQIKLFNQMKIKVPKLMAKIMFCGMHVLNVFDDSDFVMPTPEQRKNLKEMLCVEIEEVSKNADSD